MKSTAFVIFLLLSVQASCQELTTWKLFPCHEPLGNTTLFNRGVFSQRTDNDTTHLRIGFTYNCGCSLKPHITSRGDTLFLTLENTSDIYTSCDCYFKMDLTIANTSSPFQTIFIDNRVSGFIRSKYVAFPPNESIPKKQIKNKTTKDGLKTGYWRNKGVGGFYYISNYGDGTSFENNPLWIKCYSNTHELVYLSLSNGSNGGDILDPKRYELILKEISEEQTAHSNETP